MSECKQPPEMFVFNQNRRNCYGAIKGYTSFDEYVRFGACSEINFEVSRRIYDVDSCKWVDNPIYDYLVKHNLIFLNDDTKYYSFPNRTIGSYSRNATLMDDRTTNNTKMSFSQNSGLGNFQLQNETRLFNISTIAGYNWNNLSTINNGAYSQKSDWANEFPNVACTDFIPIQPYDTIALRSRWSRGNIVVDADDYLHTEIKFRFYYVHFYESNEAASYIGSFTVSANLANPVYRFSVNSLSNTYYSTIKEKMSNGGFIRVSVVNNYNHNNNGDSNYPSYYKVESSNSVITTTLAWSYPYDGWLQIYSGERRCTSIQNGNTTGNYELPLRWFVISDVEENIDGIASTKKVKCYSYEYTLANRSVSLSSGTLPLYIPDGIIDMVNRSDWIIDRSNDTLVSGVTGSQYMQRGLLNIVLECLPQWHIGHISSKLMSRYREFDNVDNVDVYTFLNNNVANAYQCYFVFDSDNLTISAYSQDDIIQNSNISLNWDNAIKHLTVQNASINRVTALRVHTEDDTYGLGLVNPYGASTIYNFSSVIDQMDFVADNSANDPAQRNQILDGNGNFVRYRTLKEAVEAMEWYAAHPQTATYYSSYISPFSGGVKINNLNDYRKYAKLFVQANMDYIKAETKLQEAIAEYHAIVDKINTMLKSDYPGVYENYLIPDKPPLRMSKSESDFSPWHSKVLYYELVSAVDKYWDVWTDAQTGAGAVNAGTALERVSVANQFNMYKTLLSHVAQKLNLNYQRQLELVTKYPTGLPNNSDLEYSILTPAEILALQPFIIEGDWTNENAVFSETYGADDIVDTLSDVMEQAATDFANIYANDNYDFETDMINWMAIPEMQNQAKRIKVGQTVNLCTETNKWVSPILLELYINHKDDSDFKMTFTTDYTRKPLQFRFADLYGTITQTSVTDNAFTFNE